MNNHYSLKIKSQLKYEIKKKWQNKIKLKTRNVWYTHRESVVYTFIIYKNIYVILYWSTLLLYTLARVYVCSRLRAVPMYVCVHNQDRTETQQMYNYNAINPNFLYTSTHTHIYSTFSEMKKRQQQRLQSAYKIV